MKTIKINFSGVCTRDEFDPNDNVFLDMLKKHYNVVVCDDPDYVICGVLYPGASFCHGVYHEYILKYPCVRIMVEGENLIPDYNLVDYSICQYPINYYDRNCYFPGGIEAFTIRQCYLKQLQEKDRNYPETILKEKEYFASFIASHESEHGIRGDFFKALNARKRVESVGTYLNNMEDGKTVNWADGSKLDFQRKCRFSLCFESTKDEGFITEKIVEAFYTDTIPVYYGSSNIKEIFNPKAFIDISDYPDFESAIDRILEIEANETEYLEMLRQPIFVDPNYAEKKMAEVEAFLCHIFDQPLEKAYRRSRYLVSKEHEDFMKRAIENELGWKELWTDREIIRFFVRHFKRKLFQSKKRNKKEDKR